MGQPLKGLRGPGDSWSCLDVTAGGPMMLQRQSGVWVLVWGSPGWVMKFSCVIAETPGPCLSSPLALQGPPEANVLELGLFLEILGLRLLEWAGGPGCGHLGCGQARLGGCRPWGYPDQSPAVIHGSGVHLDQCPAKVGSMALASIWTWIQPLLTPVYPRLPSWSCSSLQSRQDPRSVQR